MIVFMVITFKSLRALIKIVLHQRWELVQLGVLAKVGVEIVTYFFHVKHSAIQL